MIELKEQDGIAIMSMVHGKANAMDVDFCEAIAAYFDKLRSASARAVVLTGQGKIFSAGVDLPQLLDGGEGYVRQFLPALHKCFEAVFNFPKPVVAAINGHAIAGGCVLACAADRRLMAREDGRIGITELRVGVPFPAMAFEIMRLATVPHYLAEAVLGAATYTPDEAFDRGWVHELPDVPSLLPRAISDAKKLAELSPPAFAMSKRQLHQDALERLARDGEEIEAAATAIWAAPPTLDFIRRFVAQTLKK